MGKKIKSEKNHAEKSHKVTDPFAEREAEKYEQPIPSREFILSHLKKRKIPASYRELLEELNLSDEMGEVALRRRLKAMIRDGQLEKLKGGLFWPDGKRILVEGRIAIERSQKQIKYMVIPDDNSARIHLDDMGNQPLYNGNRVVVSVLEMPKDMAPSGRLIEILEQQQIRLAGRFVKEQGIAYVIPHGKEIVQDILIPAGKEQGATDGQIVVVAITSQSTRWEKPIGHVVEVLGDENTPGVEIKSSIRTYGLPNEWSNELLAEITKFTEMVPESAKQGRVDLRHLPLVTIDGEDAKDFDDAVYCEAKASGGWRLWVAIADVSFYVKPGMALDQEALARGNSVYFPGKVIPMLPEVLSNGLCSLKPKVDRLCMVAELSISQTGKLTRYQFHEAVMHSQARLTYTKVAAILAGSSEQLLAQYRDLVPHLQELQRLYHTLYAARAERGAIEFETSETRIVFGKDGKISRIELAERNEAHRIIEECMLAANVATAKFLKKHKSPGLYRNHEGPPAEKLMTLKQFLGELGLSLGGEVRPRPLDYTQLLGRIKNRPDAQIIQTILLRSLSQAVYSPDNLGHFGLAYPEYCHFTSPIRRYPDLWVHRQIRAVLQGKDVDKAAASEEQEKALEKVGVHCSMTERRADDATRDAIRWLKCQYMQKHLGGVFDGIISGVVHFGFFVELKALNIDGLVHVNNLHADYYYFDAVRHRLVGEVSHQEFKLGDAVMVKVAKVDVDARKIDFELLSASGESLVHKPRQGSSQSKKKAPASKKSDDKASAGKNKRRSRHRNKAKSPENKQGGAAAGTTATAASTKKPRRRRSKKPKKTD